MDRVEKRRVCIKAVEEDLRPFLNIMFDRALLLERHKVGGMLGYYDDVLELTWKHLGRPGAEGSTV